MRVLLCSCTLLSIAYGSRLILSSSGEDLKQLEDLRDHFQTAPFKSIPYLAEPISHDEQEQIPQHQFDVQLKKLTYSRKTHAGPLDPAALESLRNLVLISKARVKKRHFHRVIIQNDIQILHFILKLAKPKVIKRLAASKKFNHCLERIPADNLYLPRIIIHLLDCKVKIENKSLLSMFVQTPELAAQLAQHKPDLDLQLAIDLCSTGHCCWSCYHFLYPNAFETFIQYCCPYQSLNWVVKMYAKLEPDQAARMVVALLPKYMESPNIKRFEGSRYGIVRYCVGMSRIDVAVYMLIRGAPPIKPDANYGTSRIAEKTYMIFQNEVFHKIKLLVSTDSREEGYGMFALFPREIVHLILLLMFKDFSYSMPDTRTMRDSFNFFYDLLAATKSR